MHWQRAKAYLIAAFILLDLFLGYQLWAQRQRQADGYFLPTARYQQREALEQLARANVDVDIEVPSKQEALQWLEVSRPEQDVDELTHRFFRDELPDVRRVDTTRGSRTYLLGKRSELSLFEDGSLQFKRYGVVADPEAPRADEISVTQWAATFLKTVGGLPSDAVLGGARFDEETGIFRVTYYQSFQGRMHYGARLTVLTTRDGQPYGLEMIWPRPTGFEGPKKSLLTAAEALLRLAGSLSVQQPERVRVTAIGLGYYSRSYDSDRWAEPPVWQIRLDNGLVYHVNAYTGQLEP